MRSIDANGITFGLLEAGEGPLVLLLHGFPDTARTWSPQLPALAEAGYHAVAPFMRGYPPTDPGEYHDVTTLACDAFALIQALGEPAFVVGHDWGAFATYGLTAAHPESVRRAVTLALPHPIVAPRFLASYEQVRRSFYIWFFQTPLAQMTFAADLPGFVSSLYRDWSPGFADEEHVAHVIETLSRPGAIDAAIDYYRAVMDPLKGDPAIEDMRRDTNRTIMVPTLALFGADDGCLAAEFAEGAEAAFGGEYQAEILEGCGHFLHRERPNEVNRLILDWLAR